MRRRRRDAREAHRRILGAQLPMAAGDMMGKAADTDITAMAISNGLRVRQVPVHMRERQGVRPPPVR